MPDRSRYTHVQPRQNTCGLLAQKEDLGPEELAQSSRAPTTLPGSVPSTHMAVHIQLQLQFQESQCSPSCFRRHCTHVVHRHT